MSALFCELRTEVLFGSIYHVTRYFLFFFYFLSENDFGSASQRLELLRALKVVAPEEELLEFIQVRILFVDLLLSTLLNIIALYSHFLNTILLLPSHTTSLNLSSSERQRIAGRGTTQRAPPQLTCDTLFSPEWESAGTMDSADHRAATGDPN